MSDQCLPLEQPAALHLDNQLCFALYSASLMMTKAYKPLLEKLGLTYPQYLVMLILWEKDGIGLKDIAERLITESGALTPVLKRLEQQGLLTRQRIPDNERALEIKLTKEGKALQQQAFAVLQQIGLACGMELTELVRLRTELQQLRDRIATSLNAG